MRRYRSGVFILAAIILAAASAYLGFRAGEASGFYLFSAEMVDEKDRVRAAFEHVVGKDDFRASYGQDLWVAHYLYPGVTDGYFVDLGAADGEHNSNTKMLELIGWKGVCIDPFARSMENRRCTVFKEVVDSEPGRKVQFQQPGSYSGGIVEYAGSWITDKEKAKTVEFTNTTLKSILDRAGAPHFISYMNVDIEGAEYPALSTFPFDKYRIGALTVEHNDVEERRLKIRELLENNGYRLERAILDQDWYVLKDRQSARKH